MEQTSEWIKNVQGEIEAEMVQYRFIKQRKEQKGIAREEIEMIQKEMEDMQKKRGQRDWERWKQLKALLNEAYKVEEKFWRRNQESIG